MRFSTFVFKNLLHRPVRTALTVVGLSVAISAVVTLTGIAWGFERSFMSLYNAKGIDLIVVRAGISSQLSSNLSEALRPELEAIPGVELVASSLVDTVSFEDAHLVGVLMSGWEPNGLLMKGLRMLEGRAIPDRRRPSGHARAGPGVDFGQTSRRIARCGGGKVPGRGCF